MIIRESTFHAGPAPGRGRQAERRARRDIERGGLHEGEGGALPPQGRKNKRSCRVVAGLADRHIGAYRRLAGPVSQKLLPG